MGQKSNVLTLRKNSEKSLSFVNQALNENSFFLRGFEYLNFLEKFFNKKNVLITSKSLNFVENRLNLNLKVFFKTSKLTNFKRKLINYKLNTPKSILIKKNENVSKFLVKNFSFLRSNLSLVNVVVINTFLDSVSVNFFYVKMSRFINVLFLRKFSLFIDFLKICVLFYKQKVFVGTLLYVFGQIFRVLPKRKHNRFLFFLKFIFQIFVEGLPVKENVCRIKGIKFIVHGKLQGKTRASHACIQVGAVPIQSISKNIEFSKLHVYTVYGAFGFRIWVYRD